MNEFVHMMYNDAVLREKKEKDKTKQFGEKSDQLQLII